MYELGSQSALFATLVLAAVALAGCADTPAPEADPIFEPVQIGATTGVLRGVVVDETITPVTDAIVELQTGDQTTTDANGAFQIANLEPGSYFLSVSKPGWTTVQHGTTIEAGEISDTLRVQLQFLPGAVPRAETYSAQGFVQCGVGTPLTIHQCPGLDDQDVSKVTIPFGGAPDWVQVEIEWRSTQPAGAELYLISKFCDDPCDWGFDGRFDEGIFASPHVARTTGENRTGDIGVWASPGGPANGTGVALDQAFHVYATFFYNIEPAEGWMFIEDGDY